MQSRFIKIIYNFSNKYKSYSRVCLTYIYPLTNQPCQFFEREGKSIFVMPKVMYSSILAKLKSDVMNVKSLNYVIFKIKTVLKTKR